MVTISVEPFKTKGGNKLDKNSENVLNNVQYDSDENMFGSDGSSEKSQKSAHSFLSKRIKMAGLDLFSGTILKDLNNSFLDIHTLAVKSVKSRRKRNAETQE